MDIVDSRHACIVLQFLWKLSTQKWVTNNTVNKARKREFKEITKCLLIRFSENWLFLNQPVSYGSLYIVQGKDSPRYVAVFFPINFCGCLCSWEGKNTIIYTLRTWKVKRHLWGMAFGKGLGMVSHSLSTVVGQNVGPFFCALTSSHVWATFMNYCKTIIWLFDVWNVRPNVTADILLELKSTERMDFPYLKWMEKTTRSVNPKGDNNTRCKLNWSKSSHLFWTQKAVSKIDWIEL